ncbi:hypothetical protein ACTD5D_26185 [Nocardia takedensis]|uniref:hypothetical protein n=1 Tax=Nocardia takedensis TaxID=259390 RepID=UPI003F776D70
MSDVMAVDVADTAAVAKRRDAKTTVDPELFGQLVDQARLVQQPPSYWASCCRSAAVVVGSSASNEGVDGVLVEVALQCGRDVVSTADLYGPVRFEPSTYLVGRRFELRQPRRDHGIVLRSRIPVALPAHLRHDQTDWGLDQHWPRWAPNTSAVAIIDAVTVRHTRPVAGPNPTAARATGVDATAEFRDYLLTHGICDLTHSVHPSHCMVSRGNCSGSMPWALSPSVRASGRTAPNPRDTPCMSPPPTCPRRPR